MRANKVREQDNSELQNQLRESQDQLFRLRFQFGMGQMDGLKKYRELRRDRARMFGSCASESWIRRRRRRPRRGRCEEGRRKKSSAKA